MASVSVGATPTKNPEKTPPPETQGGSDCMGDECRKIASRYNPAADCLKANEANGQQTLDYKCVDLKTSTPTIGAVQYQIIANEHLRNLIPESDRDKFTQVKYNSGTDSIVIENLNLNGEYRPNSDIRVSIRPSTYVADDANKTTFRYRPELADTPIEIRVENGKGVNIHKMEGVPTAITYVRQEDFPKAIEDVLQKVASGNLPDKFFDKLVTVVDGERVITDRR